MALLLILQAKKRRDAYTTIRLLKRNLHYTDDTFSLDIYRRQLSLYETGGIYIPYARLPYLVRVPVIGKKKRERVSVFYVVDIFPLCCDGSRVCDSFFVLTST